MDNLSRRRRRDRDGGGNDDNKKRGSVGLSSREDTASTKCSTPAGSRKYRLASGSSRTLISWHVVVWCSVITAFLIAPGVDGGPRRGADSYHDGYDYHYDDDDSHKPQNLDHGYSDPIDEVMYLSKFGYLPQSLLETGALRSQEQLQQATERFQQFAGLPVTGKFDEATRDMLHKPRCGMPDFVSNDEYTEEGDEDGDTNYRGRYRRRRHHHGRRRHKRYALGPSQWEKRNLTFRILNYTPDLHVHQVRDALLRAFKLWSDVTELTFTETAGDADIKIRFARYYHMDGYPFDGQGQILAHAFFPGEDKGGDMHFDEDEVWTLNTADGINLYSVAAHELGHSLGLAHSSVLGSLMYPWYQGYKPNLQLHYDDLSIIQYLYGVRNRPSLPPGAPTTHRPTMATPPSRPPMVPADPVTPAMTPTSTVSPSTHPDPCTTSVDAVAVIRTEVFIFKGKWFWRLDQDGIMDGYPVSYELFWYGLPDLNKFDAVYERTGDGKIVFFSGKRYWIFDGNRLDKNFTEAGYPLTKLGLPGELEKIDAVFVWGYNQKTYLISGDMYWRLNEELGVIDYGYPRDMSMWQGVPVPVDAAFQWSRDKKTYFFQGQNYWKFNDHGMKVRKGYPKPLGPKWLECKTIKSVDEPVKRSSANALSQAQPMVLAIFTGALLATLTTTRLSS